MLQLLLPRTDLPDEILDPNIPIFFLIGPCRGSHKDRRLRLTKLLVERCGPCLVVDPDWYAEDYELRRFQVKGIEDSFPDQTLWERRWIEKASEKHPKGCVIAWLSPEDAENPRTDGDAYGTDTYGEIAEFRGRMMERKGLRFVMGAETGFKRLHVIRRNFAKALPDFKIHSSMEEAVEQAALFCQLPAPNWDTCSAP